MPPGWTKRQQALGNPIDPSTPGIHHNPMRYTFRDPTGKSVNRPDNAPDAPAS